MAAPFGERDSDTETELLSTEELSDATSSQALWDQIEQPGPEHLSAEDEEFFEASSPLPEGQPGDIIRAEPADAYTDALKVGHFPADVWRIMYLSTDALGEPMAVSGTVMVPHAEWTGEGERPLVAFAIGTHGLGAHCAPSIGLEHGLEYEASLMERVVDDGYALAISDYQGLGTSGDHTFMVGHSQGAAVLDSLRAATRLPEAQLPETSPMGVTGFSQGGSSAVWAAQMHPEYAPELPLTGVAAGGVPADLNPVAENLDGGPYFSLLAFATHGYNSAYPELSLDDHLTERGATLFDDVRNRCVVDAVPKGMFRSMDEAFTSDLLNSPEWQERLTANKPGESTPTVPLYLYHSVLDDVIPIGQAEELRDTYCAAGVEVQWKRTFSGPHVASLYLDNPGAHKWMGDRFAGKPVNSTC
ncbi:lipase family protein [Nocardiopsis valliformis]